MSACVYFCAQYLLVTTENDVCMSVFMYTINPGEDRHNMSACLYFCAQYLLVTTEMICLHICIYVYNTCWWRQKIICLHVCIYVYKTCWWRHKYYVCMCVFLCTILAGDDRNDVCMSAFMCSMLAGDDRNTMPACLHLCVQYILVRTEMICRHVCITVYKTCSWRQK